MFPPRNPFEKMGLQSTSRETPHANLAELAAFRATAIEMGYPSLAMKALRPTGGLMLRPDDSGLPWGQG
ncbi:hypothetical protein [Bradyrhizobium liaoningense]|uniref:hypothetical protein n=1 Tax=Bradyrhizobium liaoningense TaxID=43992 RepID=UPI002013A5E3|nr:hypothetical protein [Bradyrhizobium liaoningense]